MTAHHVARILALVAMAFSCRVLEYTVRFGMPEPAAEPTLAASHLPGASPTNLRPPAGTGEPADAGPGASAVAGATGPSTRTPSVIAGAATEPVPTSSTQSGEASAPTAPVGAVAATVPGPTATSPRPPTMDVGEGVPATPDLVDRTVPYEDLRGLFALRHGDSWRVVPAEPGDGRVRWLLRLERGQPGQPVPEAMSLPPDGCRFEIGMATTTPDADLESWLTDALPLDEDEFSVTADALAGQVGADDLDGVFREGQILPFHGRWREWAVPDPRVPGRVIVLRMRAYGAGNLLEMAHAKVVAATLRLP